MDAAKTHSESAAEPLAYVGAIDGLQGTHLSGWGVTILGDPCALTVIVNGEAHFSGETDRPRPDLAKKAQAKGQGGWRIDIGSALTVGENHVIAQFADGSHLAGSPATYQVQEPAQSASPANPSGAERYVGAIDVAAPPLLRGWAISSRRAGCPVTLRINDRSPVTLSSNQPRPDLVAKDLSKGEGGWEVDVSAMLVAGRNIIRLCLPDGTDLQGSPIEYESRAPADAAKVVAEKQPAPQVSPVAAPPAAAIRERPVAKVSDFPARPRFKPGPPTLAELDEISLDDLTLAIASGMVKFEPIAPALEAEPEESPAETGPEEATETEAPSETSRKGGWLTRLLGRRGR